MTKPESPVPAQAPWYFLWSAMCLMAVFGAALPSPVFSGGLDFGISALLAIAACFQIMLQVSFLSRKKLALSAVLLLAFSSAQLMQLAHSKNPPSPYRAVDFSAYYLAGKVLSESPVTESIYQLPRFADGRMNLNVETPAASPWHADAVRFGVPLAAPYIYPPLVAILIKPLTHLSFASAYRVWTIASVILVLAAAALSLSLGGEPFDGSLALMLGVGLFSYTPFLENLFFGQMSGVMFFLLAAGTWLLSRDHPWLSAFCYAVATDIKLTPVLAVPVLILHRQWKWLTAYVVCLAALLGFSDWQVGWAAHLQFWREVLPSIAGGAPISANFSFMASVQELLLRHVWTVQNPPLMVPAYAAMASRVAAGLLYLAVLVSCYRRRHERDFTTDLVVIVLVATVISPIAWRHHFTIALLPFLYLWSRMPRPPKVLLIALFLAVGTDLINVLRLPFTSQWVQIALAAIVPCLTIAVAYRALTPERQPEVLT